MREEDAALLHPASIWQWEQVRALATGHLFSVAFTQCCWGAPWKKPTRIITNMQPLRAWGPGEWPQSDGFYTGPLPDDCGCTNLRTLAKRHNQEKFRTTGTAEYPIKINEALATAAWEYYHQLPPPSPCGGVEWKEEADEKEEMKEPRGEEERTRRRK